EAPPADAPPPSVELLNIHLATMSNAIAVAGFSADHIETLMLCKLRTLCRREVRSQQLQSTRLCCGNTMLQGSVQTNHPVAKVLRARGSQIQGSQRVAPPRVFLAMAPPPAGNSLPQPHAPEILPNKEETVPLPVFPARIDMFLA